MFGEAFPLHLFGSLGSEARLERVGKNELRTIHDHLVDNRVVESYRGPIVILTAMSQSQPPSSVATGGNSEFALSNPVKNRRIPR
ncbi:hypothetical protein V2G26_018023 [Clonostachys chloroleuca]